MKHTEYFKVNSHETDYNGIVRPSCVMRYMQETANLQFNSFHPTLYELNEDNKSFLLSRSNMSIYSPLHNFDNIKVESWACEGKGATYLRCGRIYRDDVIVAEIITNWALVDRVNQRFIRQGEIEFEFGTDEPLELDMPRRITIPIDLDLTLVGERTIYYGDIDLYGHMNNTNYPDMLCAFLPSLKGKMVVRCAISFLHDAPLGETVKVYLGVDSDTYYFRTVKEDGTVGVEAEIVLEDI